MHCLHFGTTESSPNKHHNGQNKVLGENNQVLLTIGPILRTTAEYTGWLNCHTVPLNPIGNPVPGYQEFLIALSKTIVRLVKK